MGKPPFLIKSYKNRVIDFSKPVKVYRNLTVKSSKVYSIKQNNLVVGHASALALYNVKFIISEPSRLRVLKERQRNVHAYASGMIATVDEDRNPIELESKGMVLPWVLSYNPYITNKFVATSKDDVNISFDVEKVDYIVFNQLGVSALNIIINHE
jgi:hypothetical protein